MIESLYDHIGFTQLIAPANASATLSYSTSIVTANVKNALIIVKRTNTAASYLSVLKLQFSTAASVEGTTAPTGATDITGASFASTLLDDVGFFDTATGDSSLIMFDIDLEALSQQTTSLNASTYTHMNIAYQSASGTQSIYAFGLTGPQRYGHKGLSFTTASNAGTHVLKVG